MAHYLLETDFFGLPLLEDFKSSAKKFQSQGAGASEVETYIQKFKALRDKQRIKDTAQKDIDAWAKGSFDDFKKFVDGLSSEKSATEKKKEAKSEGAELVAQNARWLVYRITSKQACMTYGSNTQWCITSKDTDHWDQYIKENNFYFILSKAERQDEFNKIAAQVDADGTATYWDETDHSHKKLPKSLGVPPFIKEKAEVKIEVGGRLMTLAEFLQSENLEVQGDLEFTSVKALPKGLKVSGDLNLSGAPIRSLPDGLEVGGNLYAMSTKLDSLPKGLKVGGTLDLHRTEVRVLPSDLKVGGGLWLIFTEIDSLPDHLTVNGDLALNGTPIATLPSGLVVKKSLHLLDTKVTALPDDLKVGGKIFVSKKNKIKASPELKKQLKSF